MMQWVEAVFGEWQTPLQAMRGVTLMLWTGLAFLTITLFILMRTRWGQAKPLSKCIALSVVAHVLFGAYAYGTRLFFDVPPGPNQDVVHLAVLDPAAMDVEPYEDEEDTAPWDELADTTRPSGVDLPTADRVATSIGEAVSEAPVATEAPDTPDFSIGPQQTGVVRQLPVDGIGDEPREPIPNVPESLVNDSVVEAAPIERPAPLPPAPVTPAAPPLLPDAARAMTDVATPIDDPGMDMETPEPPEMEAAIQQLADAAIETRRPDARISDLDNLKGATNETPDAAAASTPAGRVAARTVPAWAPAIAGGGEPTPAPRRLGDGRVVPPVYRARVPDLRLAIAKQHGGSEQTEAAVEAALAWLASQQLADGRWSCVAHGGGRESKVLGHDRHGAGARADTAVTGLAVLSMLAAGNTHYEGDYRKNVQRGLEFLLSQQRSDGCLAGNAKLFAQMYCHGMASLAISEAFAMTGDQRLKQYVERAVAYSLAAQDPYSGGWRYQVGDRGGDMSQFGWQVMALKSAELAGMAAMPRAEPGIERFLTACQKGARRGLAGYRPQEGPTPTMTAEALACRFFLRKSPTAAQKREATEYLLRATPGSDRRANYYYWYYGTLAMFQHQGDPWRQWNAALTTELLQRQEPPASPHAGSFAPDSVWGGYGGRVYSTAMATLCLEVYYRYLPLLDEHDVAGRWQSSPGRFVR